MAGILTISFNIQRYLSQTSLRAPLLCKVRSRFLLGIFIRFELIRNLYQILSSLGSKINRILKFNKQHLHLVGQVAINYPCSCIVGDRAHIRFRRVDSLHRSLRAPRRPDRHFTCTCWNHLSLLTSSIGEELLNIMR